jgi:hypothetical protein
MSASPFTKVFEGVSFNLNAGANTFEINAVAAGEKWRFKADNTGIAAMTSNAILTSEQLFAWLKAALEAPARSNAPLNPLTIAKEVRPIFLQRFQPGHQGRPFFFFCALRPTAAFRVVACLPYTCSTQIGTVLGHIWCSFFTSGIRIGKQVIFALLSARSPAGSVLLLEVASMVSLVPLQYPCYIVYITQCLPIS